MTALAPAPTVAPPKRGFLHVAVPLLVCLLAAAGAAGLYYVFVLTGLGQTVDTQALQGADVSHPRVAEIMNKTLNGTTLLSLIAVCLAAATVGVVRRRIDLAVGAAVLVIGANLTTQLAKAGLHRPNLDDFPAPNSFPSGHTTAAVSVAFALMLVLPSAIRGTVALIGAGYVTVIAVATVWAEWHRPSDTAAALLIVLSWSTLVATALRIRRLRVLGVVDKPGRAILWFFSGATLLTAFAGGLGLLMLVLSERVTPDLVSGRFAFLTAAACITAAVTLTFLIWVRLAAGDQPVEDMATAPSGAIPDGDEPTLPMATSADEPPTVPLGVPARNEPTARKADEETERIS